MCVCDPSYYGQQCQSPLSNFGVVTMECNGELPKDPIPETWGEVTDCTSATVRVDAYDVSVKGFNNLQTLNVALLAGVYLIIGIVAVAYVVFSEGIPLLTDSVPDVRADTLIKRLSPFDHGIVAGIFAAAASVLMETLAVLVLVGGIIMLGTASPVGVTHQTPDTAVTERNIVLLPMELLLAVCSLTVISRLTRGLPSGTAGGGSTVSAKFVTLLTSVMLIVVVCNAYYSLSELAQLLAAIPFAAFVLFESIYILSRLLNMDMHMDVAYLGVKTIVVVGAVYVASRQYANFKPNYQTLGTFTASGYSVIKGDPGSQLGPKGDTCNFLVDDMLKSDGDSSVTEQWLPWHSTSNLTKDETWWCGTETSGSTQIMRTGIIWIPMLVYLAAVVITNPGRFTSMATGGLADIMKEFTGGAMTTTTVGQRLQKYTRIRVAQGP